MSIKSQYFKAILSNKCMDSGTTDYLCMYQWNIMNIIITIFLIKHTFPEFYAMMCVAVSAAWLNIIKLASPGY